MKICASLCTSRNCPCISAISRIFEDIHDKLMDRCISCHITKFCELAQKQFQLLHKSEFFHVFFGYFLFLFHVSTDTVIDSSIRTFTSKHRKFLRRTAYDRGMQYSCQRNILQRIVTDSQIVEKCHHLLCRKISCSRRRVHRNPSGT